MVKRVLVVDNNCVGENRFYQYVIVDIDGDFKSISQYTKVECDKDNSTKISSDICNIFYNNNCDEIYMDAMGSSYAIYESIPDDVKKFVRKCKLCSHIQHKRICNMINDFNKQNIFIESDSLELYDVIKILGDENGFYRMDHNGLLKIGKFVSAENREKLHMILGMYCNK